MRLTAHLTADELACRDGTPYPAERWHDRVLRLAMIFERIRSAAGHRPLRINSAYRTRAHNLRVGGSPRSQHLAGRALDLACPDGLDYQQFHRVIRDLADELTLGAVGHYPTRRFVHVDIRPRAFGAPLIEWTG